MTEILAPTKINNTEKKSIRVNFSSKMHPAMKELKTMVKAQVVLIVVTSAKAYATIVVV